MLLQFFLLCLFDRTEAEHIALLTEETILFDDEVDGLLEEVTWNFSHRSS